MIESQYMIKAKYLDNLFLVLIGLISFQVLGVDRNASQRDIQKAFHKYVLLKNLHLLLQTFLLEIMLVNLIFSV